MPNWTLRIAGQELQRLITDAGYNQVSFADAVHSSKQRINALVRDRERVVKPALGAAICAVLNQTPAAIFDVPDVSTSGIRWVRQDGTDTPQSNS